MNQPFDFSRISEHDQCIASQFIGSLYRPPDLVIAPAGHGEYLYRWYVTPHSKDANIYFHVQTASDPERPLHDHPWDSTSVILAGGYEEIIDKDPEQYWDISQGAECWTRIPGDVILRRANWAHRLILPAHIPYSMSLFTTGPKVRDWGFWLKDGWIAFNEITIETDGNSTWDREKLNGKA